MITRDYSSHYKIKEFLINEIAPKFFDLEDINQFNVGLLGYTTEMQSVTTEDTFNAMNIFLKEIHPSKATMADTIYTYASIYGVENIMGRAAQVRAVLFIKEDDIIDKGVPSGDRFLFTFDSNAKISIGGIPFSLDYDIIISARPYRGSYQFQAQYDMKYKNSMSRVVHPYINTHRVKIESDYYIALDIYIRQYERTIVEENLITNDRINLPVISVQYNDQLAGIDVYYKEPGSEEYIVLEGRMRGTVPSRNPFFFYSIKENNHIEISFTGREKYFTPKYNSDLKIILYTTKGNAGNFTEYIGNDIQIINDNTKFDYMRQIIPFLVVNGPSIDGKDALSLEDIRTLTVESMATSGAYNTEEDINLFFKNYTELNNLFITFIKKRDDLVERLFSGFMLFKDKYGDYFHTNTLHLDLYKGQYDYESEALDRYVIRPGRIFKYKDNDTRTFVKIEPSEINSTNVDLKSDEFLFTNPFLIIHQKKPNTIGYYINTVDKSVNLDFEYADVNSPLQFIANTLKIKRNSLIGEKDYTFTLTIKPTRDLEEYDDGTLETDGKLKVLLSFEEKDGKNTKALIMSMVSYDKENKLMTFEAKMKTEDLITASEKFIVGDLYDIENGDLGEQSIRMVDCVVNINILYNYDGDSSNDFTNIEGLRGFTLVNRYSTESNPIDFITPVNFIRSRCIYDQFVKEVVDGEEVIDTYLKIYQVPLIGAHHIRNMESLFDFINEVNKAYSILKEISKMKTSNYNIDLKFYNTYGRSLNFTVGEEENLLDRTNISIHIKVKPEVGVLVDELFDEIKRFIKEYIENINTNKSENIKVAGYNAIYVSNLIQQLENNFPIEYMKFVRINQYDSSVQVIENNTVDTETMSFEERRDYIPEFLTIHLEDIKVEQLTR